MLGLFKKFIGTANERAVKKLQPAVARINELEAKLDELTNYLVRVREPKQAPAATRPARAAEPATARS